MFGRNWKCPSRACGEPFLSFTAYPVVIKHRNRLNHI